MMPEFTFVGERAVFKQSVSDKNSSRFSMNLFTSSLFDLSNNFDILRTKTD